jgi:hypothetical protein
VPAVEIRFCDLCNESVPLADLRTGRARQVGERVICAACEAAMAEAEPAGVGATAEPRAALEPGARRGEPRRESGGSGPEWAAGFAILVAGGLGYLAVDRTERSDRALGAALDQQQRTLAAYTERLAQGEAGMQGALEEQSLARSVQGEELRSIDLRWRADLEGIAARLDGLGSDLDGLGAKLGEVQAADGRLSNLERGLLGAQRDLQSLTEAVLSLSERLASGAVFGAPKALTGPTPPADPAGAEQPPAFAAELEALGSPDYGARWAAVDALGRRGDPAAAPFLVPCLGDSDFFVRMAAARALGQLGNLVAVPALIEALVDPEPSVAEAAVESLRLLTGRNFKFDPIEKVEERKKRAQAWRDWWERSGSSGAG